MASDAQAYIPSDIPFSLACSPCDAGMEFAGYEQTMAKGWSEIDYDPGLPMTNFIGLCPDG